MENVINWFAIPVLNLRRAILFYNSILDVKLEETNMGGTSMAFFPKKEGGVGGHLFSDPNFIPSQNGPILYLNGSPDLQVVMDKIEKAGGKVLISKTKINSKIGHFGMFLDSEGNRLAIHSRA